MVEPELLDKILLWSGLALGVIASIGVIIMTFYKIYMWWINRRICDF